MSPSVISTVELKAHVERTFAPDAPGREAVLALPDQMDRAAWDAALPILVRLLRLRSTGEGPP